MKKLLLLFIPLMFFFSCELFNEEETLELDSSLFGNWIVCGASSEYYQMNLSSSGNFVWMHKNTYSTIPNNCFGGATIESNSGIWWIDGGYLILSGDSWSQMGYYVVGEGTLEFDNQIWEKE